MDRLDAAAIVVPGVQVRVLGRCTSTNSVLLKAPCTCPVLLAAEEQTAGRGRRGRRSEERRVGKECRSPWSPEDYKQDKIRPRETRHTANRNKPRKTSEQ